VSLPEYLRRRPEAGPTLLGGAVFGGLCITVAATRHALRTDSSPIVPSTHAWLTSYRIALIAAFAGYAVAVVFVRRRDVAIGGVLVVAASIQLIPLAGRLLLSRDVYTYWDKGRLEAFHGRNPFDTRPSAVRGDVAYKYVAADWKDRPTFYGPTMAAVAVGHAEIVGASHHRAAYGYRLLAAASMVAVVLLAAALAPHPPLAVVLVGWNPLLALHFAGGGHIDALMMALVLGGFLLAGSRPWLGGAVGAAGIALKWILLVFAPLELLRRPRRFPVGPWIVAGLVLTAISFAVWGTAWLHSISQLRSQANMISSNSFAWWLSDQVGGGRAQWAHVLRYAFFAVYAALLLAEWRTGRARIGLAAGLLVAATPFLSPWYLVWPAALTAIEEDDFAVVLVVALNAWMIHDAVPF
jgi:alpha-1,6-mannosyltransferase